MPVSIDVYARLADLAPIVTGGTAIAGFEDRLASAVILGSRYVDSRLGIPVADEPVSAPYGTATVNVVDCDPRWRAAAIVAATRFYKSSDVPFGVVGGWEYAVRAQGAIPEVDMILGTNSVNIG